jgi:uncharacterized protein YqgC (DUF456 family)
VVPVWAYYLLATLLLLANVASAVSNLLTFPGNWFIVAGTCLFAVLVRSGAERHVSLASVAVLIVVALLGEGLEMLTGLVGAARQGASRRSLVLSIAGSIVGSIGGAIVGLPIPLVGSAIAALLGGAGGAFAGAALGEDWKGRALDKSLAVGASAFWGRLLGTVGKTICGFIMVVIAALDAFL